MAISCAIDLETYFVISKTRRPYNKLSNQIACRNYTQDNTREYSIGSSFPIDL